MESGFIFSSKPKQISKSAKGIAERIFGNLSNLSYCSIGNDEIINSISRVFEKNKLFRVEINEKILKNFDKTFYSKKMEILRSTDILIMCIDQKENLISKKEIVKALADRKQKPLLLINASIPGNINMDVNNVDNCFLFDLNDLEQFFSDSSKEIKSNNDSDEQIQDQIEYFISKFSQNYNLDFDQKYILESKIKNYFGKVSTNNEKFFLLDFINNLYEK